MLKEWHEDSLALKCALVSVKQVLKDALKCWFKKKEKKSPLKAGIWSKRSERLGLNTPSWTFSQLSCCAVWVCPAGICRRCRCAARGVWGASRGWASARSGGPSPKPGTKGRKMDRTQLGRACYSSWPQSPGGEQRWDRVRPNLMPIWIQIYPVDNSLFYFFKETLWLTLLYISLQSLSSNRFQLQKADT